MTTLQEFKTWALNRFTPRIALVPSQAADDLCLQACGVDIIRAFQSHGCVRDLNKGAGVPIRTPAEYPIRLHELNIRFCLGQDVAPLESTAGLEAFEGHLLALAHGSLLEQKAENLSPPYDQSYFEAYREAFFRGLQFQVHETQDDPLMCVFVLHTDSIPGCAWKGELRQLEEELTPKMKACLARRTAIRHVLFVGDLETHEEDLRGMETELGAGSRYLMPNMLQLGNTGDTCGVEVSSFVERASSLCLLPHIESLIRELEVVIAASRRGLKNQLKSFLFRRTPSDSSISSSDAGDGFHRGDATRELSSTFSPMRQDSVEAAMRRQSDLLMLVGDFGTAVSTLKLLSSDLKSDKRHFHYAAAQESLATATLVGGGSVSASIMYFKEAFLRYARLIENERALSKSLAATYCTRVALQWAALLGALNRISEASWILMRAHFHESNARAAFLLEYAAHLLLQERPPKMRKYGFYLVLAALRYGQSQESSLSFIAHKEAIRVLQGKGWDILEEHVHEALDHEYLSSGEYARALEHAIAMMRCFNLPSHLQSSHMAHMLDVYAKVCGDKGGVVRNTALPAAAEPTPMGLPMLDTSHMTIICAGSHDYHDEASRKTSTRVWKDMELDFPRTKVGTIHGRQKSDLPGRGTACVGEDIILKIPVSNPLKIPLEMMDIELLCEVDGLDDLESAESTLERSRTRLLLGPGEEDVLVLSCRLQVSGFVSIQGVRWILGGIPCKVDFEPQVSKWSVDCEIRPLRGGPLKIQVMPPMPRLRITMSPLTPLPEQMLVGEIVRCELALSNVGASDLGNVECVASPNVYLEGTDEQGDAATSRWYKDLAIAAGETQTVNIYLRPDCAGHQDFYIVWRYQSMPGRTVGLDPATKIGSAARYLRFSRRVYAEPSLVEAQALIIDCAAEDNTDMVCFQARTTQNHRLQLNSLIVSSMAEARTFDLRGISALLPSDASPESGAASYEFDEKLSAGKQSTGLDVELDAAESHFLCAAHPGSSALTSSDRGTSPDALHRACGVIRWYTSGDERSNQQERSKGFSVFHLTKSTDSQAGHHGTVIAQLAAPASLQHNFANGPLTISIELQILSKMIQDIIDATWMIGNTPLGVIKGQSGNVAGKGEAAPRPAIASSKISWKGEPCGMQVDIKPEEKRFVILEGVATQAGTLQLDAIHIQWHSRSDTSVVGSTTLPASLINVMNVRPIAPTTTE